jgi:hypothetical protein
MNAPCRHAANLPTLVSKSRRPEIGPAVSVEILAGIAAPAAGGRKGSKPSRQLPVASNSGRIGAIIDPFGLSSFSR